MQKSSNRRTRQQFDKTDPRRAQLEDALADLLPEDKLADALSGITPEEFSGPGGILNVLTGRFINAALKAELTDHLGYQEGEESDGLRTNIRNGFTGKTVRTEGGPAEVLTPRDRNGSFEPKLVAKRQRRLAGLDERILAMYARGMTVRDISEHLKELYGVDVCSDTISTVTDGILDDIEAWRSRPLSEVYAIVYLDAIVVKVREDRSVKNRSCHLAIGVTLEGEREVLGLWWQEKEGAKFWLSVLNDMRQRGMQDVLIACVDGLTGFPDAIEAVFPLTWVQTCIVHQIRNSLRYVSYREKKAVASDLKPIYNAINIDDARRALEVFDEKWGARYPMITRSWEKSWEQITPFLALPVQLRKIVYTTNAIENLNRQIRKAIKNRGHFPDEIAASKLIYLAISRVEKKWKGVKDWSTALRALKIHFGDRIPD